MAFYSGPRRPSGNPGRGREYVFNRGSNRWEVMDSATGRTIGPVSQTGQLLDSEGNVRRTTAPAPTVRVDENLNVRPTPAPAPAPQQTVTQPEPTPEPPQTPVEAPAAAPEEPPFQEPVPPAAVPVFGQPVEPDPIEEPAAVAEPEPAGPTEEQQSALDVIRGILEGYGLAGLEGFMNDMIFEAGITNPELILARLRVEPETSEAGRVYQERFKGNKARRAAGLAALSEGAYIQLETELETTLRRAGLPATFYDSNDDFAAFIGADVSPAELGRRIDEGYKAVTDANPQVIAEMRRLYGVDDGTLAAYFLDPTRAEDIVIRQAQASRIAAQGRIEAGIGISATQAEELAREGITEQQARAGFGAFTELQEVFQANVDEQTLAEQAFTQEEQVGAIFGTSAAAQQRLRQRQRRRQAQFEAGGRFATQDGEIVGLR